jgi:hypothetical protein
VASPEKPDTREQRGVVERSFSISPDLVSFYSDYAHVLGTADEVMLNFYETIPGLPNESGNVEGAESRLRATVTLSMRHAGVLARLLQANLETSSEGPEK